jgi:hypothetical protein
MAIEYHVAGGPAQLCQVQFGAHSAASRRVRCCDRFRLR